MIILKVDAKKEIGWAKIFGGEGSFSGGNKALNANRIRAHYEDIVNINKDAVWDMMNAFEIDRRVDFWVQVKPTLKR